ncbi:MAG: flagellar hook-length control protein FliK [Lachnospiraceae bacterium]|nr:flagellar hook-length control protein FliK [Lachnospiraceae bacterium]
MASMPVNNNLNALANTVSRAANLSGSQNPYANASYEKQEEAVKDTFDTVMSRVNAQTGAKAELRENKATVKVSATVDTKSMAAGVTGADKTTNNVVKNDRVDEKASVENEQEAVTDVSKEATEQDIPDDAQDAVTEAGEELVNDVAEEMGITPEEVEEAMEVLGLTAVQLLDPANMQKLLMAITGNEDQLSILTDAELYSHLQNLLGEVSTAFNELQAELGISAEELNALIADMAVAEKAPEVVEIPEEIPLGPETDDVNLEGMKDYAVTVHKDGETVEVKVTVDDASGAKSVQEEVTAAPEAEPKHDAKSGNRNAFGDHKGESNQQGMPFMQTMQEQPNAQEINAQQPVAERFVDTQDIMNQIMEYMKINLKGDVQELELQLHPASLGNVHVQIASKDGAITAQFTAQNEAVKAAIESQLIQLKTQFEEQGIKVDAVEVTVANYQFEQSFSGNEEHEGEKQGNGKKGRRNINLKDIDLDDMPEDMDDSERIATEMMAQNGNTVDYTA